MRGRLLVATPPLGGLHRALEELCERFAHRGLQVTLAGDAQLPEVPANVAVVTIRVASEALANAGAGPGAGHLGLLLMRERARAASGSLTIDSAPGRGTRVALDLPLPRS